MELSLADGDVSLALRSGREQHQLCRLALQAIVQPQPFSAGGAVLGGQAALHPQIVFLINMLFRGQQVMGQSALVGQQQQPLRVLVQPPHRE